MEESENNKDHARWMKRIIRAEIRKYLKNKKAKERAKMEKMSARFLPKKTTWINA